MEWNIIALQLTATGVLFSFALSNHSRTAFLLIVPVVSYVLSGRYLRNDRAFILIGVYIKTDLSVRVPGLNFEWWYKSFPDPNPSRTLQKLAYGPAVFSGISIVALAWLSPYIFDPKNHISSFSGWRLGIAWWVDVAATAISIITMAWTMTSIANESEKLDAVPLVYPHRSIRTALPGNHPGSRLHQQHAGKDDVVPGD